MGAPPVPVSGPGCAKCGQIKKRFGNRWRCRPCEAAYQRVYMQQWHAKNREAQVASSLAYAAAHRQEARERARRWHAENPERARKQHRANYLAKRAAEIEKRRQHYRENREQYYVRNLERLARKRGQICTHGDDCVDAAFLKALYGDQCLYCGSPAEHADHFVPLALGGLHCRDNLVPACSPCNLSKAARDPWQWMEGLAM